MVNEVEVADDSVTGARIGTLLLFMASVFAVLIFADRTESLALELPGLWYRTRRFHILICVVLGVCAAVLLKSKSAPAEPKSPFRKLMFYTRAGCPLCDEALETLEQFEKQLPPFQVVFIDEDPLLISRFGESVPVVEIDGRIRFRGGVNPVLLKRLIDGSLAAVRTQERSDPEVRSDFTRPSDRRNVTEE